MIRGLATVSDLGLANSGGLKTQEFSLCNFQVVWTKDFITLALVVSQCYERSLRKGLFL